ncbi:helix-turn-helix domain-containing protein [Streptomyces sp. SBT349]|uniref:helix-turn-helix domain-containing protein n=1 Tax=Streptomyces sp. SBT349 TaxID=1580539 RepID=UPI00066C8A7B|nr:helix-turn-helix transcriptional regulator [Streptomyces sp. SBT349]
MSAREKESRTHFSDLVRTRRQQLRLSLEKLSDASIDPETGTQVKQSWIHRLEHGEPVNPPSLAQLRALALGLELRLSRMQDAAAAEYFGLERPWPESAEARDFAMVVEGLTLEQQVALERLLDAFFPRPPQTP